MNKVLNQVHNPIYIKTNNNDAKTSLEILTETNDFSISRFEIRGETEFFPKPIILEWKVPSMDIKGVWKPTSDFSKRIEADWELENHESRISIDAPVIALFGNKDQNILCFSCSNAINLIELGAKYREEDNCFYCQVILFTECKYPIKNFSVDIRLDYRNIHFSDALRETSKWWETKEDLSPAYVPSIAKKPLYSTWYQFHQDLEEEKLLAECEMAKKLGFESIVIDDGWQTKDNNRGYDYTGDWKAEHFEDFADLVNKIQEIGLKVGIWYSVPFCGKKSQAYKKFKGKFLTENHRWAPVFDPRYKEVREYLVQTYVDATKEWNLDGLKLDFIDDFKSYPETSFEKSGKDTLSINQAVDMLLEEVIQKLQELKPDIFIEFRQKYTGPAMRKYGNMLRAFDCPGDPTMNRVRITDIKMLAGHTMVHADMVKWHFEESVEVAALHYLNTFFGVPQISVMLTEAPEAHLEMVDFYTSYWIENSEILLSEKFYPKSPLENYPVLEARTETKSIIGLYANHFIQLPHNPVKVDILNTKLSEDVILTAENNATYSIYIYNCMGKLSHKGKIDVRLGANLIKVPPCGLLQLHKNPTN